MSSHDLFFYGTLVHPKILARVIGRPGAHLTTCDALLPAHTRHHVIGEDYPAVVPLAGGRAVLRRELTEEESRVQGSLVKGLTDEDLSYLDEFEGDEYTRLLVSIVPSLSPSDTPVQAETYLWTAPISRLSPSLWSFQDFLTQSAHRWVGEQGENNEYYGEVDRRRAMGGIITPKGNGQPKDVEDFGREFGKKWWNFEQGYINLNHGSYGVAPRPVVEAYRELQDHSNSNPDQFMRVRVEPAIAELRLSLSQLVGCAPEDLVLVPNATMGVNVILRSLTTTWKKGDRLLYFSHTIYNACQASLQYIIDSHPHLELTLLPVPITYPISHKNLLSSLKEVISQAKADGHSIRLALFDAISSNPGVVVPWQEVVKICKEESILTLVDAAHEIGQLHVNLSESKPDFWLSNCHKWLMAHRGAAVLYVDKKYQPLIHSIPIGHYYRTSPSTSETFQNEFAWNGTIDFSSYLSIEAALAFRRDVCGGEERITEYCHRLAAQGGEIFAKALGTEVMKNENPKDDGDLIANMSNVRLPLSPSPDLGAQVMWLVKKQLEDGSSFVPVFMHNSRAWIRLSAQVYNSIEDFEEIAPILVDLCERVKKGEWKTEKGKDEDLVASTEGIDLKKE